MAETATVPVRKSDLSCKITPPWFVGNESAPSEYHQHDASFELLINGENAFGEVHKAIAGAKKSICIICWGFQPSMYFIRDGGQSPSIGKLLEQKANEKIHVRILSWTFLHINANGAADESNTPGRGAIRIGAKPASSTPKQYHDDVEWYSRYDQNRDLGDGNGAKEIRAALGDAASKYLHFVGRGFSASERNAIRNMEHEDKKISGLTNSALATLTSHHQKMVLVDYEDPDKAIGFVMGHNMLDEYWDTSEHSVKRYDPDKGRNGLRPREDISSRVTGPIVGDLFSNFAQAWQKETGEKLPASNFGDYPIAKRGTPIIGQIVRTQPQYGVAEIKRAYLQAVKNASQYIYIENQYFRWPPLAEAITQSAKAQAQFGRKCETHNPLFLFVITNADSDGMGKGVVNTQRMMESLGRADTLPEASRNAHTEDAQTNLNQTSLKISNLQAQQSALWKTDLSRPGAKQRYDDNQQQIATLKEEQKKQKQELERAQDKNTVIQPKTTPGLKTLVCTLVAPDSGPRQGRSASSVADKVSPDQQRPLTRAERIEQIDAELKNMPPSGRGTTPAQYQANITRRQQLQNERKALLDAGNSSHEWVDVYIHAKLMLIDDAFMTVGSANINTRSMETDSELNILHSKDPITTQARKELWALHTNQKSGSEPMGKSLKDAYDSWSVVISDNKKARAKNQAPLASIIEFFSATNSTTNLD